MNIEPPARIPTFGLIVMFAASVVGVWLLGWELWRRL